jgi:F-type H+-transporting ATPase subunit gamma
VLSLEQLRRQVEGAEDLHALTRAMKALAAVRIRQSREAVRSLADYSQTVEYGLRVAIRTRPRQAPTGEARGGGGVGRVVFGSDLGLVGRFNLRIVDHALTETDEGPPVTLISVGSRVSGALEAAGHRIHRSFPAPNSVDAIAGVVQELLVTIDALRTRGTVERFELFYNHSHTGATYRPHRVHLLPLNREWLAGLEAQPWPTRQIPTHRVPWPTLFAECVREHLFVTLYSAAARSQAAENASRLAAMEAAERRIDERLTALRSAFNQQRQQRITDELLDLVTGFLALEETEVEDSPPPPHLSP